MNFNQVKLVQILETHCRIFIIQIWSENFRSEKVRIVFLNIVKWSGSTTKFNASEISTTLTRFRFLQSREKISGNIFHAKRWGRPIIWRKNKTRIGCFGLTLPMWIRDLDKLNLIWRLDFRPELNFAYAKSGQKWLKITILIIFPSLVCQYQGCSKISVRGPFWRLFLALRATFSFK